MKSFAGKVILLTGAAGTGKSTLASLIQRTVKPVHSVDYGQLLLERLEQRTGSQVSYSELRWRSSSLIAHEDVEKLDRDLIRQLSQLRRQSNVVIDSHAVTKEASGFRVTPYSLKQLGELKFDSVVCLQCEPNVLVKRIRTHPQGRRRVTIEEARHHQFLQEAVAEVYAITCGCPLFIIDNTKRSIEEVAREFVSVLTRLRAEFRRGASALRAGTPFVAKICPFRG